MQAVSPRPSIAAHSALNNNNNTAEMTGNRPAMMKRQSSASSHNSRSTALSPTGSVGEYQPLRHHVKPAKKGAKVRLPLQNHGSGRNLVKLAQQAQTHAAEERRRTARKESRESKESETETRLPGSWDERKSMRRNLTATNLPRNTSLTKLKKNLSHGQLTRLAHNPPVAKGPPSPGLKGRHRRPKSADMAGIEKDLHEQEVELAQQQQEKKDVPKKVGFDVASSPSEDEDLPQMDGSGLQEDEWTDQSNSASPYSTRQNTANNSRRASVVIEKPPDKRALPSNTKAQDHEYPPLTQVTSTEDGTSTTASSAVDEDSEDDEDKAATTTTQPAPPQSKKETQAHAANTSTNTKQAQTTSLLRAAKEHPNPAARRILSRNNTTPAPALVSNVSALDDARSGRGSPAPSMVSSRSNLADTADSGELVSRFMPSASHPSTSSVPGTNTLNTPKTGSIHTPDENDTLLDTTTHHPPKKHSKQQPSPSSPKSRKSLPTPATATTASRFRNESRLLHEKLVAEKEDLQAAHPIIPAHIFDRRNESLKSYLNLASLGGDGRGGLSSATGMSMREGLFEGRFKAVNTELKVVQRFRDPVGEAVGRLGFVGGFGRLRGKEGKKAGAGAGAGAGSVKTSRSAVELPPAGGGARARQASGKLSSSASPPPSASTSQSAKSASPGKSASALLPSSSSMASKSTTQIGRVKRQSSSRVTFSGAEPEMREDAGGGGDEAGRWREADEIARALWEGVVS